MWKAACHCGLVRLTVQHVPEQLTCCNCSICYRIGALWAYFLSDQVQVTGEENCTAYAWGDKSIRFYSCKHCGCTTHYRSILEDNNARLAINARMASIETTRALPRRYFDGADSWQFVERFD